jgi:hypothetical protein
VLRNKSSAPGDYFYWLQIINYLNFTGSWGSVRAHFMTGAVETFILQKLNWPGPTSQGSFAS